MKMHGVRVASPTDPKLELVELDVPEPGRAQVRIKVEACGICHSDAVTVHNLFPGIAYPRCPGHEIAGTIDAVGEQVAGFAVGDRVGVGWHGGHCGHCDRCRRGDFITCRKLQVPGITYDGGYAEYVVVPEVALARIPERLSFVEAAPLMCAGVTTYNALRNSGAKPGDLVAILGLGGLGHLAVQYAVKMGFHTVAFARGPEKAKLASDLGATEYVDGAASDMTKELQKRGGAKLVLATITSAKAMAPAVDGLAIDGQLLVVGVSQEPLELQSAHMVGGRSSVKAWPSGTCVDSEDTMNFSVLTGVRAMVETMPRARAADAYAKMMAGDARFRMVITS